MENLFADILKTVVENGRLEYGHETELEDEIYYETVQERGLSEEQAQQAVEWALAHYQY